MIAAVAAVKPEELTLDEQRLREQLERQVELAFYQAGVALQSLRDKRLYRSSHRTFEEYCRDRFGHSRQKSNYLIALRVRQSPTAGNPPSGLDSPLQVFSRI